MRLNLWDKPSSTSMLAHYICKNTKNIQKSDLMNEFCLQDELDLTLFICLRVVDGILNNQKSLMTLMTVTLMTRKRP